MESLMGLLIVIALCVAFAKAIALLASSKRQQKPIIGADWQPPAADPLPYRSRPNIFSPTERAFYEQLKRIVPPSHTICAKVRVADLLLVPRAADSWQSHFNRISSKHVDFVVCDAKLVPVVAIELDDSSHYAEDRKDRDAFLDSAFAAAGMPLVHFRAKRMYDDGEIQQALSAYLPILKGAPAQVLRRQAYASNAADAVR